MSREEFLRGLEDALSGNVPPSVVRDNLRYYDDYIRTERQKGRSESDIMDELGEPRLIARTIMDTTPGAAEGEYEEYHPFGSFSGQERRSSQEAENGQASYGPQNGSYGSGNIHYYNLNKWYWKVLAVVVVIAFFTLVITIVGGILSLVIPLLPIIGIVVLIMWLVQGPRR